MQDNEIEIIKYKLQNIYLQLEEIIKLLPDQYHDLKKFNNKK